MLLSRMQEGLGTESSTTTRLNVMQKHVTLFQMLISQRTYYVLDFHSQVQHVHLKTLTSAKTCKRVMQFTISRFFFIQRFLFHLCMTVVGTWPLLFIFECNLFGSRKSSWANSIQNLFFPSWHELFRLKS